MEGDVKAAPAVRIKPSKPHEGRDVHPDKQKEAEHKREEHPPARHIGEVTGIGVKLLLFVQHLGEREPLRDIVYGGEEKSYKSLSSEQPGKQHRKKDAQKPAALQELKKEMERQHEREKAERAGGNRGRYAEHHIARAEAHRRNRREERGDPIPAFKALEPREARENLPQYKIDEDSRDSTDGGTDDPQCLDNVIRAKKRKQPCSENSPDAGKNSLRRSYAGGNRHLVPERRVKPAWGEDQIYEEEANSREQSKTHVPLPYPVANIRFLVHRCQPCLCAYYPIFGKSRQ